jgi:hypothetical protein
VAENAVPDPYNLFDYLIWGISAGTQSRAFQWDKSTKMQDWVRWVLAMMPSPNM